MAPRSFTRIGIVTKRGLVAAAEHLVRVTATLLSRGLVPVLDEDTVALLSSTSKIETQPRDAMAADVDEEDVEAAGSDDEAAGFASGLSPLFASLFVSPFSGAPPLLATAR